MWLLPRSSMFELGHDRRKSYRAANGSFGSNSPVAASSYNAHQEAAVIPT